ncbi:MAG: hypothetical protein IPL96_17820 [Holophagaceae bacterium]|nr:hypothetical protein [Holophagaceae bacterium]
MALLKEAGFQRVERVATDGKPGVFANSGRRRGEDCRALLHVRRSSSIPRVVLAPLEARIVDKPGFGKVAMGRGAVNQKGPEAAFLAALHAYRGAGRKLPVNLVLVAEGEEDQLPPLRPGRAPPDIQAALAKTMGVFMPGAGQGSDGEVTVSSAPKASSSSNSSPTAPPGAGSRQGTSTPP